MVNLESTATRRRPLWSLRQIARDYAFVMPGFFISLVAFVLLVPLTFLSIGTLIIWIGALLLPLALQLASMFAELSRARVRHWGVALPPTHYPDTSWNVSGILKRMAQPRRWLDLTFETLVAFPIRTFTFVVATTWTVGALAGTTYGLWSFFLPDDDDSADGLLLELITGGAAPDSISQSAALDIGSNFVLGVAFLLTLPIVMRGLARLDAAAVTAALGGRIPNPEASNGHPGATSGQMPEFTQVAELAQSPAPGNTVSGVGWAWITAITVAVVPVAVSWPLLAALYEAPVVLAMLVSFAYAAALLCAVRWPAVSIVIQSTAIAATALITVGQAGLPWPWPVMTLIVQAILVLLVSLRKSWPWAAAMWLLPQIAVVLATLPFGVTPGATTSLIVSSTASLGVLALGVSIRQLLKSRGDLRAERQTSAELSSQQQELKERNRIAQELHDVVAHSMSVISVQATTAKYRIPGQSPEAEGEFQSIAASSRQALTEMRSLLSLLRSSNDDHGAPLAPQPTLADLPTLIEASRQSGAAITLTMRGSDEMETALASVPPATGLTAYRIAQEALSNAMRHSPGAPIDVVVSTDEKEVTINVTNGPVDEASTFPAAPGAGLGLDGVQERAIALGGSVETGATEDGGYHLNAVLPIG